MIKIEDYIKFSKQERQAHLRLNEPCIERGCNSEQCRGLLAHILDTTIKKGTKIHACHSCNNSKCNNPYHLYWGTPKENAEDFRASAKFRTIWQRLVDKYGLERAIEMQKNHKKSPLLGNPGIPKSEEIRNKISSSVSKTMLKLHAKGVYNNVDLFSRNTKRLSNSSAE